MKRTTAFSLVFALATFAAACEERPSPLGVEGARSIELAGDGSIGINVLLNTDITPAILSDLETISDVKGRIDQIDAVFVRAKESSLRAIRSKPYVEAATPDAERKTPPGPVVQVTDFANGLNTWNLDAVNVTPGPGFSPRSVPFDGSGVYVGVLDTGLVQNWRQYFPDERIAVQHAIAFGGGGAAGNNVTDVSDKWEHDTHSHGTHVTSTIIGYSLNGTPINGVAPKATVIPVKVLNNNGSGWSSVVAEGIVYVADLAIGELAGSPVVINMSLGGSALEAVEQAAIDYAIDNGVIIVAAAGNSGNAGMSFPAAYAPVISAAASGWIGEWRRGTDGIVGNWWFADDVAEPTNPDDFYITGFSSRERAGQDLDVAAPGSWVVGPFHLDQGGTSFFFLGGTSMASPHVAGIVALMAQQTPGLTAPQAEVTLEATAIPLAAGCRNVAQPSGAIVEICWSANATGEGLATADAALGLTTADGTTGGGKGKKE